MAKKRVDKPWGVEPSIAKKEAKKSIKGPVKDDRGGPKVLKVFEKAHKRAKFMAFRNGMSMVDYVEHLINKDWEENQ